MSRRPAVSLTRRASRDLAALEMRRFQAAGLFARGRSQTSVARALGVTRAAAHSWYHTWKSMGRAGLKAAARTGRKPRLGGRELGWVRDALREGPLAHGFDTDRWTSPRIATVIERLTGVRYDPAHVRRLIRRLNWAVLLARSEAARAVTLRRQSQAIIAKARQTHARSQQLLDGARAVAPPPIGAVTVATRSPGDRARRS